MLSSTHMTPASNVIITDTIDRYANTDTVGKYTSTDIVGNYTKKCKTRYSKHQENKHMV
jgi:hypothetical protein